jgi:putative Holliday junction resolvase
VPAVRYLGIDFGTKRVGLALSDEDGVIALPHAVLPNDSRLLREVVRIARERNALVVMGESKDYQMRDNPIMAEAREFARELEKSDLAVYWHPEFMTSVEATRTTGKNASVDASAAAVMLQSFLELKANQANQK